MRVLTLPAQLAQGAHLDQFGLQPLHVRRSVSMVIRQRKSPSSSAVTRVVNPQMPDVMVVVAMRHSSRRLAASIPGMVSRSAQASVGTPSKLVHRAYADGPLDQTCADGAG